MIDGKYASSFFVVTIIKCFAAHARRLRLRAIARQRRHDCTPFARFFRFRCRVGREAATMPMLRYLPSRDFRACADMPLFRLRAARCLNQRHASHALLYRH